MLEVTDGKTNYTFCCISDCGKYAAFAQYDGRKYRVYDLEDNKQVNDELTRGNTAAVTRCMYLARD